MRRIYKKDFVFRKYHARGFKMFYTSENRHLIMNLQVGDMVEVSIEAYKNSELYEPGCEASTNIRLVEEALKCRLEISLVIDSVLELTGKNDRYKRKHRKV